MHSKIVLYFFVSIIFLQKTIAQENLTLQQAIAYTLNNNFDIIIAAKNQEITIQNNSSGNAGMLPQIGASGAFSNNISNTQQNYFNGTERKADNAKSSSLSNNIMLNWTVFDGLGMFMQKQKYEQLQLAGEWQLKSTIENKIAELTNTYYAIVLQQQYYQALQHTLQFSKLRNEIAKYKQQIGRASEITIIQSEIDLNTDSAALLKQRNEINNLMSTLNFIMGFEANKQFNISDTLTINNSLTENPLLQIAAEKNSELQIAEINLTVSQKNIKIAKSPQYPKLSLFAGYNYNTSQSQVGLIESSRNFGPTYGANLSYTIFNGFQVRRNINQSKIYYAINELLIKKKQQEINTVLLQYIQKYKNQLALIEIENKNEVMAKRNCTLAMEKYKLGEISDLDLRQIQLQLTNSEYRLLQAQYQAKIIETEIKRITGEIIK